MDLKRIIKNIAVKDSYSQSATLILLSKGVIVLFTFGITPIIARYYSPAQYGTYAVLNSFVVIFTLLSNWSLSSELLICKENEINKLVRFIIQLGIYFSILFVIFLFLIKDWLFHFISFELNSYLLLLIPLYVVVITISEIFAGLNIRDKNFKTNIIVNTTDNLSNKSTTVLLGFFKLTYLGLIVGDIIGKTLNVFVQINNLKKKGWKMISAGGFLNLSEINDLILKYSKYWKYQLPTLFIQRFSNQFIIWFLAIFYTSSNLGHFTMGVSLLSIPLILFSNSFQPIISRKIVEVKSSGMVTNSFDNTIFIVGLVSLIVYSTIFFICDWFVPIYLSDMWLGSIVFIKILCFSFFMTLIGNSISGLYIVFGQQKLNFSIKLISLVILFVLFTISLLSGIELNTVILIFSLITFIEEIVRIILLRKKLTLNI